MFPERNWAPAGAGETPSMSSIGSAMNFTWAIRTARGLLRLGAWVVLMEGIFAPEGPRARVRIRVLRCGISDKTIG